jgi:hypothetical protein
MRVRVTEHLGDLIATFEKAAVDGPVKFRGVVKEGIRVGNIVAKDFARESAGAHGKLYHRAFSAEMHRGGAPHVYSGEYGPNPALPQGGMSFEWGSRNQPPHQDLNKSADIIGPAMVRETRDAVQELLW